MKIAIIGAGAMGCLYGSILSSHCEVTLFDAAPAVVDAINAHVQSLTVRSAAASSLRGSRATAATKRMLW